MNLEIKKDPVLIGFYSLLAILAAFLMYKGIITWVQLTAFIGISQVPSLVGKKDEK